MLNEYNTLIGFVTQLGLVIWIIKLSFKLLANDVLKYNWLILSLCFIVPNVCSVDWVIFWSLTVEFSVLPNVVLTNTVT